MMMPVALFFSPSERQRILLAWSYRLSESARPNSAFPIPQSLAWKASPSAEGPIKCRTRQISSTRCPCLLLHRLEQGILLILDSVGNAASRLCLSSGRPERGIEAHVARSMLLGRWTTDANLDSLVASHRQPINGRSSKLTLSSAPSGSIKRRAFSLLTCLRGRRVTDPVFDAKLRIIESLHLGSL